MGKPAARSTLALSATITVWVIVLILAILQYRWTSQISQAEEERIKATLTTGAKQFGAEFLAALTRLASFLLMDPSAPAADLERNLSEQYFNWESASTHQKLVAALYLYVTGPARAPELRKLDLKTGRFEVTDWPGRLEPLRRQLDWQQAADLTNISEREAYRRPWIFYDDPAAIARPIFQSSQDYSVRAAEVQEAGFLVAELNLPYLQQEFLPELAARYFGRGQAEGFDVLVQSAGAPYRVVYPAGAQATIAGTPPDASASLLDPENTAPGRRTGPVVTPASEDRQWQVVVRYASGTLEAAVAALRWKNLAISFGLLFALAACTALILELSRRAHRLAELQMEFVAGVSHELCTPLAVINSAADNLADGVMDGPEQTREYGGMIRDESRRLARMVDEVLLFAAGQSGRLEYGVQPVEIGPVVERALDAAAPLLSEAGFVVEKKIAEDLPAVMGDPGALGQCLENLLSNAVKYGRAGHWVAVRVRSAPGSEPAMVEISVEDKGPGIPPEDTARVFEPFIRTKAARDAQIRGVGLGLHLVKRMVEAMGGRVDVSSRLGWGTAFTLHLAAAPAGAPAEKTG